MESSSSTIMIHCTLGMLVCSYSELFIVFRVIMQSVATCIMYQIIYMSTYHVFFPSLCVRQRKLDEISKTLKKTQRTLIKYINNVCVLFDISLQGKGWWKIKRIFNKKFLTSFLSQEIERKRTTTGWVCSSSSCTRQPIKMILWECSVLTTKKNWYNAMTNITHCLPSFPSFFKIIFFFVEDLLSCYSITSWFPCSSNSFHWTQKRPLQTLFDANNTLPL